MLDTHQEVFNKIKTIKNPEKLKEVLDLLNPPLDRALKFVQKAKEEGIFEEHWKVKGMEDVWREWARKQGIKEGHFLFEN